MKSFNPLELTKNTHMFHILCILSMWQHLLKKTFMYSKLSKCHDWWSSQKTCLLLYLLDEQTKHFFLQLHCTMYVFLYTCKQLFISVFFLSLLCLLFCFVLFCFFVFLFWLSCFAFIRQCYSLTKNNVDRDVMVNFEPGEYMKMMIFLSVVHSLFSGRAWLDY